jgi:uncharacterized pyridoxal phosphate-containing UPF0001 family protein
MDISKLPTRFAPAHRPVRTQITPEQIKYVQLKLTTKMTNVQMAKQVGVHVNTITNWNKSQYVQNEITEQIGVIKRDNAISMQGLMASLIREAGNLLDDDGVGATLKIQLIGQLFSHLNISHFSC